MISQSKINEKKNRKKRKCTVPKFLFQKRSLDFNIRLQVTSFTIVTDPE